MGWIQDGLSAYHSAETGIGRIEAGSFQEFNDLCREVRLIVEQLHVAGINLYSHEDGLTYHVAFNLPSPRTGVAISRALTIQLVKEKRKIIAKSPDLTQEILLRLRSGSIVLELDGQVFTVEELAQKIMQPFLFEGKSPFTPRL